MIMRTFALDRLSKCMFCFFSTVRIIISLIWLHQIIRANAICYYHAIVVRNIGVTKRKATNCNHKNRLWRFFRKHYDNFWRLLNTFLNLVIKIFLMMVDSNCDATCVKKCHTLFSLFTLLSNDIYLLEKLFRRETPQCSLSLWINS